MIIEEIKRKLEEVKGNQIRLSSDAYVLMMQDFESCSDIEYTGKWHIETFEGATIVVDGSLPEGDFRIEQRPSITSVELSVQLDTGKVIKRHLSTKGLLDNDVLKRLQLDINRFIEESAKRENNDSS